MSLTSAWSVALTDYFPTLAELPAAKLQGARDRAESYLRTAWGEVDMRPNSPIGDAVLTPFAHLIVALEIALGRFMSDLDLEQVASGIIFNCDFTRAFLKNFAVQDQSTLRSTGVVRLVFNVDQACLLDRGLRFQLNNSVFFLRLAWSGHLQILPVGSSRPPNLNSLVLVDMGDDTYTADVPVFGTMGAIVTQDTVATLDTSVIGLISARALSDFIPGAPETSLEVLATKTRETFTSSALVARVPAVNFIKREFPEIIGVSAVVPGDNLMLRASVNALGISAPAVDLYVKSAQWDTTVTQTLRIPFVEAQESNPINQFIARLSLSGRPTRVHSIASVGNPAVVLLPGISCDIYTASADPRKAPLLTCAGTSLENLYVVFPMPLHPETGSALISTQTDSDGVRYAFFEVTYTYDPLFEAVESCLTNPDVKPANCDLLVRPFVPLVIDRFNIAYTKQVGMTMKLDTARSEIHRYLRTLSYPAGYSDAKINDAMFYAGAEDVMGISISASVRWSAADFAVPSGLSNPVDNFILSHAYRRPVPVIFASNTNGLKLGGGYVDAQLTTGGETLAAAGLRNLTYLIAPETITFSEQLR